MTWYTPRNNIFAVGSRQSTLWVSMVCESTAGHRKCIIVRESTLQTNYRKSRTHFLTYSTATYWIRRSSLARCADLHRIESGAHVYLSEKNENPLYIVLSGCVKIEVSSLVMTFSADGLQASGTSRQVPVIRFCPRMVHVKDPTVGGMIVFCRPSW